MNRYGLHGKLKATAGNGGKLADILLEAAAMVATAKGCRLYAISRDDSEPDAVWITEIWDTKEDHDNSLKVPGVRELIGRAMPIIDGPLQKGQELTVIGGFGIWENA